MASRLDLHNKLEQMLGSRNVYYNPPESKKMEYDAIRYAKKNIDSRFADDRAYSLRDCYEIIVIARQPDHPIIKKLLEEPYCSYERQYKADNLYHDVLTLYY